MIVLPTSDARTLLDDIKARIDARDIRSWTYDGDGDFTLSNTRWTQQAWLRPVPRPDGLHLYIVPPADTRLSGEMYAVYHSRFVEMVLRHFDERVLGRLRVSPLPEGDDAVS